jgi:hypothetical protein
MAVVGEQVHVANSTRCVRSQFLKLLNSCLFDTSSACMQNQDELNDLGSIEQHTFSQRRNFGRLFDLRKDR